LTNQKCGDFSGVARERERAPTNCGMRETCYAPEIIGTVLAIFNSPEVVEKEKRITEKEWN